ncbi:flagellar hook-length control protein FliK [Marinobacter koreensis]
MLNRITVNQLHSQVLTTRAGGETGAPTSTMLLELPWLNAQQEPRVAQLRIEQNDREGSEADSARKRTVSEWRLNLVIDLDEAGPLHFDVAISQTSVGAKVWAERQSTLRQVNEQLPTLRKSLSDLGLEVTELESRLGKPRQTETRLEHRLVDTRA